VANGTLVYRIPGATWTLELPAEALRTLQSHAQLRWWSKEAAGQLFSSAPGMSSVRVDGVTKLPSKAASRTGLRLDIPAVAREREILFKQGLHCIGFWHTHPEPTPSPSTDDIALAAEHALAGRTAFAGLVFVIVGTSNPPEGIGIWVHDGVTLWRALQEPNETSRRTSAAILNNMKEHYISVDIESSGPVPGEYSMLSLGASVIGDDEKTFYTEFKPLNNNAVPEALEVTGFSLEALWQDGVEPAVAMANFAGWLEKTVPAGSTPVFVGLNAPFDWSFVNYYFVRLIGTNPLGHSALDIKALYMGATGCTWTQATSSQMAKRLNSKKNGTHNALDDALYQAELFRLIRGLAHE
jgi:DNA polymerase III epsilon subunit-like protein